MSSHPDSQHLRLNPSFSLRAAVVQVSPTLPVPLTTHPTESSSSQVPLPPTTQAQQSGDRGTHILPACEHALSMQVGETEQSVSVLVAEPSRLRATASGILDMARRL